MKTYRGLAAYSLVFLILVLVQGEWSAPHPGTNWIGGWMGPRVGLDPTALELRPLCRCARSQSLYRQGYRGSTYN
jgi:hypothetical protein